MTTQGKAAKGLTLFSGRQRGVMTKYTAILAGGKVVACLYSDGVLRKVVRGSIHRLRTRPGWAIDEAALLQAQHLGAHTLEVHDSESNTVYRASVAAVLRFGSRFDFGYGQQVGLDLRYWCVVRAGQYEQGALFGRAL
jgi:hypothetical protein